MEEPNQTLEELSSKIINQAGLSGDPEYGSVIIILMFISITIGCIRAIQECNKNKLRDMSQEDQVKFMKDQIRKMSRRKSWFSKMRIRKILRREMEANQYKKHGATIVDAILHTGDRITDDEVLSIMEALNV